VAVLYTFYTTFTITYKKYDVLNSKRFKNNHSKSTRFERHFILFFFGWGGDRIFLNHLFSINFWMIKLNEMFHVLNHVVGAELAEVGVVVVD